MTTQVERVTPSTDLFAIVEKLAERKHRRFPVVDGERLVGLITRRDLLDALYPHACASRRRESTYELIEKQRRA